MSDDHKHEIVIIHRGGHGGHDEHHGGVWKIAFADFMTAMMAFFLVMWLLSANDKTRASVAHYFNPVKLVDATTLPSGLHDTRKEDSGLTGAPKAKPVDDKPGKETPEAAEQPEGKTKEAKESKEGKSPEKDKKDAKAEKESSAEREKRLDSALRENPYAALAEIVAAKAPGEQPAAAKPRPVIGRRGGDSFRDPFAPPPPLPATAGPEADDQPDASKTAVATAETPAADVKDASRPSVAAQPAAPTDGASTSTKADGVQTVLAKPQEPKADAGKADEARKEELKRNEAKAMLAALKPSSGRDGPGLDVRRTAEGLLVSFTDTSTFTMFPNGSAVPARKLVLLMENVAKLLKTHPGDVVVRGFTDNKPYRSGRYDNWHLSLDRAQVTHYMLVRGGFDDARIGHVEGYADRAAKPGIDPANPLNRRIEILLREPA